MSKEYSLLIVDDHEIWRSAVRSMLSDTEFVVVGEASTGSQAVEAARDLSPEIVLLDIRLNGHDWLDALVVLKQEHPGLITIVLTSYESPAFVVRATAAGAAGYLLKGTPREEIIASLRTIVSGDRKDIFLTEKLRRGPALDNKL